MSSPTSPVELFHRISHPASAEARRLMVELGLEERVRMRNLTYPEVEVDFVARGGTEAPAVWDGAVLHQGLDAVRARLQALAAKTPA